MTWDQEKTKREVRELIAELKDISTRVNELQRDCSHPAEEIIRESPNAICGVCNKIF